MVLTNWKFVATVRGIGFQPVCEKPCVCERWPSSCHWEAGITLKGSTNWKFVATARGIGFQPVCEKTCVCGDAGLRRADGRPGSRSMVLTNWKFVATGRGIGFQPVESKPIPLAQNPPPTHDLPRRGDFSQPGVAASAATPGQRPPRATSTL